MRWARLVLAVMLVVGCTSAAVGECAWVFWQSITQMDSITVSWKIDSAFSTRMECIARRDRDFEVLSTMLQTSPGVRDIKRGSESAALSYVKKGHTWLTRYVCLPDTLDPREKKES